MHDVTVTVCVTPLKQQQKSPHNLVIICDGAVIIILFSVYLSSGLQAQMEALERSLLEEKERSRTERERRKILHNTLVVRILTTF